MVATGEMKKKVSIQKYTATRGAEGGVIKGFVEENTMWAKINPLSGQERVEADKNNSNVSHRISMRFYSPGLTPADRIVWNSRTFDITAVIDVGERGCFTVVDVKEKID